MLGGTMAMYHASNKVTKTLGSGQNGIFNGLSRKMGKSNYSSFPIFFLYMERMIPSSKNILIIIIEV